MKIAILGTGVYGIVLALSFYKNYHVIHMWTKFSEERSYIKV